MRAGSAGALSGCVIWVLVCLAASTCLVPFLAGMSNLVLIAPAGQEWARSVVGPRVCPEGATSRINRTATMVRGSDGFDRPGVAISLECLDASGKVILTDAFALSYPLFIGGGLTGLLCAAGLAMFLAAPAGALITRLMQRRN